MKQFNRVFALLFAVVMTLMAFTACGNNNPPEENSSVEEFSVTFANTSLNKQTVEKGSTVARPNDPTKDNCIFGGWFNEANFQTEVQFPITVNSDVTIYAQFFNYKEAFKEARNNTIGDTVPGFAYNYTLNVNATYNRLSFNGNSVGSAKYSKTGDVNFYDEHTNSGSLFYDGSKYQIRRGTVLQTIALDENDNINSCKVEEVDNNYKYDSSSFAKAVFTYSDDQLKSISPTNQKNIYKLNTALNFSSVIALVGNYVNHPIVARIIGELPETSVKTGMFVTFSNGKIDSYRYEMTIDVSNLQFSLVYALNITDSGIAKTIVPREFAGLALSSSDIQRETATAAAFVNAFRNKTQSGYDYLVKTGVDYGATTGEINSTFDGSAFRKVDNGEVYFHNDIEIDSDYKNSDLYKNAGIADVHVKQTRLANGQVHLIEKRVLADRTQEITDFTPGDNTSYYLFDVLSHTGTYTFAKETTDNGVTNYTFGLSNSGVAELLTWLNASLDLNPLNVATANVLVYGNFVAKSIDINTGIIVISVKGGVLDSIKITIEGDATTAFAGSADFTASRKAQIKLDYKLTVNSKGDTFEPYETVNAAK